MKYEIRVNQRIKNVGWRELHPEIATCIVEGDVNCEEALRIVKKSDLFKDIEDLYCSDISIISPVPYFNLDANGEIVE